MSQDPLSVGSARLLEALDFAGETAELERLHRRQMEDLLLSLIEVLDSFDRLLEAGDGGQRTVGARSVSLIARQLEQALDRTGIEPVPCLGETADPRVHEIVALRPSNETAGDVILAVERRGWSWKGQLLRRPQVVVAHDPSQETNP